MRRHMSYITNDLGPVVGVDALVISFKNGSNLSPNISIIGDPEVTNSFLV